MAIPTEAVAGIIGGVVGGLVNSYLGPRSLDEWRERKDETRRDGPRKHLLLSLLEDDRFKWRTLKTLSIATGTNDEECRRLLIEIGARGKRLEDDREAWGLISRNPLDQQ